MGIKKIDEELCVGCGICSDNCPMDVIRLNEGTKKAFISFGGDCATCYSCEADCPTHAIHVSPEVSKPFVFCPYDGS
jgi:NAD-dependent dihydropyrimidine dehydrogenase PreA subunit